MKKLIAITAVLLLATACTNNNDAMRVLQENGFTDIQMTGYNWFACSKDDTYHSGFTAKSVTGVQVSGTVCQGLLFKNSTIRFN